MVTTATNWPKMPDFLRAEMEVTGEWVYLDHAAVAPIPTAARRAMERYVDELATGGDVRWLDWARQVEETRRQASILLSCEPTEIALVPNTTFGINLVAFGIRWRPGDNLVVPRDEFPSNLLPWRAVRRLGVEVREVSLDSACPIEPILAAIDSRTRLVTVSWVDYLTGNRLDVAELGHAVRGRGARFFVDAIQGLGAFPLSVKDAAIDFLAADGHKWMLGPEGAGIFYVRRDCLEELDPLMIGWGSVPLASRFSSAAVELKNEASRYEGGSCNMAGLIGLSASLALLLEAGCHDASSGFADGILRLSSRLIEGLRSIGIEPDFPQARDRRSGIVSFVMPNRESHLVRQHLWRDKIVVSVRHGRVRVAMHAYNTADDIDRLLVSLEACSRNA